jgi:hypothetical protein
MDSFTKLERYFPEELIYSYTISTGTRTSDYQKGVHVCLYTRDGETAPCSAEVYSDACDNGEEGHYAEVGLTFEGKKLVDYDGVADLPDCLGRWLKELGYDLSEVEDDGGAL